MRFAVDGWDPSYGTTLAGDLDLEESDGDVTLDVETSRWQPIPPVEAWAGGGAGRPPAVVFVDGVRRVEARVWIDDATDEPARDASVAICASYAAGVVCCCAAGAHVAVTDVRRGLFALAEHAVDVRTPAGTYTAYTATVRPNQAPAATLSAELQTRLTELEVETTHRTGELLRDQGLDPDDCLVVVDGPLRDRGGPRTLGFVKSHRRAHLPTEEHLLVGSLESAERTPVFALGQGLFRRRYSWYLRLPCRPAAPWSGVVRIEASADLAPARAIELANLSQRVLPRFGSVEYKDARAPQNLYPVAGLERELRRRLGDPRLLHRALRVAARR